MIYLSYVNFSIQLSQSDEYPTRNIPYRYLEAIYRTQVEYSGSVTRQILTTAHTIMYKKDSFVTVLSHVKWAILLNFILFLNQIKNSHNTIYLFKRAELLLLDMSCCLMLIDIVAFEIEGLLPNFSFVRFPITNTALSFWHDSLLIL